jgi:hypothetical protein
MVRLRIEPYSLVQGWYSGFFPTLPILAIDKPARLADQLLLARRAKDGHIGLIDGKVGLSAARLKRSAAGFTNQGLFAKTALDHGRSWHETEVRKSSFPVRLPARTRGRKQKPAAAKKKLGVPLVIFSFLRSAWERESKKLFISRQPRSPWRG